MYTRKRIGAKWNPCGTPDVTLNILVKVFMFYKLNTVSAIRVEPR